ncbi:MAG: RNA polymerase sigma factor [Chloroflexota bacterium]
MDRKLLLRSRAGDREAFDLIVAAKAETVYRTALAILGNDADARDAAQDAFVAAWRKIRDLRDVDRFDAWLGRILINHCRSALRRRGRVREVGLEEVLETKAAVGSFDGTDFDEAFGRLSVDQRAILVLHHLHGYGIRDIANWLGIPSGTVKWRLSRARGALQQELDRT